MTNPRLTIFTAPKPFRDSHISTIQYNAICSWKKLEPDVAIVLIGDEEGVESVAKELNVHFIPDVKRNQQNTPLISSIFEIGRNLNTSPLLAYINADIIIFPDFLEVSQIVLQKFDRFLLVGQRWDLEIRNRLEFSNDWQSSIQDEYQLKGKIHPRGGSDYFIYPRQCFSQLPKFAVGRAGWDNWMFYHARCNKWPLIDATKSIQIIHQTHDYSHLPGGQAHYRLPETSENVRLAGGRRTIFTLMDVNYEIENGKVRKFSLDWKKFWREIEIFPLINSDLKILGQLTFSIFHPKRAYQEFRTWLKIIKNNKRRKNA
ncbi:MAG: hypothetical protein K0B14_19605 [Anaerolineaceae bacterium]|nr:hypothetical protein [Anaerolineaceae bacterium]